jgi:hypothetical protein
MSGASLEAQLPLGVRRQVLSKDTFASVETAFRALFVASFEPRQRRRVRRRRGLSADDDGCLPGPSVEELLENERGRLHGYFSGPELVGFTLTLELGGFSFGDYIARDRSRSDLVGLGPTMLACWLAEVDARNQDAMIEVEPPAPNPNSAGPAGRGRLALFERAGFRPLPSVPYSLPGGPPMVLAFRPSHRRLRRLLRSTELTLGAREISRLIDELSATYGTPRATVE